MVKRAASKNPPIMAMKVNQWLPSWDEVKFDPKSKQSKPQNHFLICTIKASHLKALTGVYRRSTKGGTPRVKDPNVQRGHEEKRSETIREFVKYGFPWCEMGEAKRNLPTSGDLRKPGWLPTAILVNILSKDTSRNGKVIPDSDRIELEDNGSFVSLKLPDSFTGPGWEPKTVFPMEVIDGQHRLWAFDNFDPGEDFELPVVAFYGLDLSWQAYLFWSVNITPKKINRSLAFDLYPLLRKEDWLDKFEGHSIYRETRSQELVEALWSHQDSPWFQRINMLGESMANRESDAPMVSQAAWIRSLMATFVKPWEGSGTRTGGLFGAPRGEDELYLPWNRPMQAAFLILIGKALEQEVRKSTAKWARQLRTPEQKALFESDNPAFFGSHSLFTTDQGIRGFLSVFNDLCYLSASKLKLDEWDSADIFDVKPEKKAAKATDEQPVSQALKWMEKQSAATFVERLAKALATYDWRTSSTPDLTEEERLRQAVFRGSSGYRELRRQLLLHLKAQKGDLAGLAEHALGEAVT
jgi:DGQHR domain-containing protein